MEQRMTNKILSIAFYNVLILFILLGTIELATRTISWVSANGFTLSLHELDPYDRKIKDIYQWHPFTGFTFAESTTFVGSHPNQDSKAIIKTDKYGFLTNGQELEYNKIPNEIRIATIGGSTTANINLQFDKNWPGHIGGSLQKNFPNKHFRVINAGVPGFDTSQSIANLALRVMPFKPDIVIIYHAYNDLKAIQKNIAFRPDYSHIHTQPYGFHKEPNFIFKMLNKSMFYVRMRNKTREANRNISELEGLNDSMATTNRISSIPEFAEHTFEQHIRILINIARAGGSKVILSTYATLLDPKLDYTKPETIHSLSDFQKQSLGSLLHFTPGLTLEGIFDGISRYNDVIRNIAAEEKCVLVDNAIDLPHAEQYFVDRVHFSEAGAEHMANNIYSAVVKILSDSQLLQ